MRLFFVTTQFASLLAVQLAGQDVPPPPPPPPALFVAADVHVAPKTQDGLGSSARNAQLELRNTSLLTLILQAYSIDTIKLIGGPRWLDLNRYVVIAKAPAGSKTQEMLAMLKPLLVDRFGLKVHEEQRPFPSYTLTVGKGKHKLKASDSSNTGCRSVPTTSERRLVMHLSCSGYTISNFASLIGSLAAGSNGGRIVDKTGLEGKWDIDLEFTQAQNIAAAGPDAINLSDAIEKQLGLKLEMEKTPQTVIVIDSVNATPTPNEPGVESKLDPAPPPPTIEVATIKMTPPGSKNNGIRLSDDGKNGATIQMLNIKINGILAQASDIPIDRVVGLPPGINDQAWDIVMKLQTVENQGFSFVTIRPLLMGLLKERFNLKAHVEDRPVDAYKLVAVKPKMPAADPSNRATCSSNPLPDAKDPREKFPTRTRLLSCQNMTLDEFAERLQSAGTPTINAAIVNATKLDGMWDFMLNFTPAPPTNNNPSAAPAVGATGPVQAAPAAGAADPTSDITFFDAVSSQLGLKLELEKRVMPVLIIDHVDAVPTDN